MIRNALRCVFLTVLTTLIVIHNTATIAIADDMVLGIIPEGIYPVSQTGITLVSEEITVMLPGGELGQVSCRFDFKNNGDAQTVIMGVPARLNEKATGWTQEEFLNIQNFAVFHEKIEGPVPVKLVDSIPNQPMKENNLNQAKYSKWYTFSIDFDKGEELSVYIVYGVNFPYDNMQNMFIGFELESGALWEGSIDRATVIFDLERYPMYSVTEVSPNNLFRIEDTRLIWERDNFEPTYNLRITQNNFDYSENKLYVLSKDKVKNSKEINHIKERIALFETDTQTIKENKDKYYKKYIDAIYDNAIEAIYIKSALDMSLGNESPEITKCNILEHKDNTWVFEISATDLDMDIMEYYVEVEGIDKFTYQNDIGDNKVRYDSESKQFSSKGRLVIEENKPFNITFIMKDSAGNFDTETLYTQEDGTLAPFAETAVYRQEDNNLLPPLETTDNAILEDGSSNHGVNEEEAQENESAVSTDSLISDNLGEEITQSMTDKKDASSLLIIGIGFVLVILIVTAFLFTKSKGRRTRGL